MDTSHDTVSYWIQAWIRVSDSTSCGAPCPPLSLEGETRVEEGRKEKEKGKKGKETLERTGQREEWEVNRARAHAGFNKVH